MIDKVRAMQRKWMLVPALLGAVLLGGCGGGLGGAPGTSPGGGSGGGGGGGGSSGLDFSAVGQTLDSYVGSSVNGYAFVLVGPNGTPYYSKSGGTIDTNTQQLIASASKAPAVAAIMTLVDQHKLDLDTPVAQYLGNHINWPQDKQAITLRMLLQMRSGLQHIEVGDPVEHSDTNQVLFVGGTQDMAARAIAKPLAYRPGTHFEYSSLTTIILSEIITRTLTSSRDPRIRAAAYRQFAADRLFKPAGVKSAFLEFDGAGTQIGGSLIYMTLDDWGRMGTLLVDGKAADGAQVIPPDWLAFMKTPSPRNPEYGAQVWLNRPGGLDGGPTLFPGHGPETVASMVGHLGQYVIAGSGRDPHAPQVTHRIVLVRLGKTQDGPALEPVRRELGAIVGALIQ